MDIKDKQKEYIIQYKKQGWQVTPVAFRGKKPILGEGWNEKLLTEEEINKHFFNGNTCNIGILLGEKSGNLIDVDIDDEEALQLADMFLPTDTCKFGRKSTPDSHYLFISQLAGQKFEKVFKTKEKKEETCVFVEIHSKGRQTVFPGSIHESGEEILWTEGYGPEETKPKNIDPQYLQKQVGKIASVCLLARFYWGEGVRQELSLCLASILLRSGWKREEIENFFLAICVVSGDDEYEKRLTAINNTEKKIADKENVTGLPRLQEITDRSCADLLKKWLKLSSSVVRETIVKVSVPPLVGYSLKELMAEKFRPLKFLVEAILPEGFTILAGKPKIGKSILASELAMAIARGVPTLGGLETEKVAVAYFALEDNKRRLQKRARPIVEQILEQGGDLPQTFTYFNSLLPLTKGGYEQIENYLDGHPQIRFIVIDTIGRVKPPSYKGNVYEVDTQIYSRIHEIYLKRGVSIMVITHTKKQESGDFLDNVTGSAGSTGVADTVLVLTKHRIEKEAVLKVTGRDIEEERELALRLNGDLLCWELLGSADLFKVSTERQEIIDLMKVKGEMQVKEIAELLGKERSNVNRMLISMQEKRLVIKLAKGLYILSPKISNIFTNNNHINHMTHVNHMSHNNHNEETEPQNVTDVIIDNKDNHVDIALQDKGKNDDVINVTHVIADVIESVKSHEQ